MLVMKQRRYERVYKRIADLNVTFCEKGEATEHIKNDHFVSGHFDCSVICCDVEEPNGLDAQVLGDILAHARAIYLLCKFDITSFHLVAI